MSAIQTMFDYSALEAESRLVVQQKTSEIRDRVRRAAEDVRAIGERLLIVKGHLEHGQFGAWLEVEFGWSERSARNMMAVATKFKTANFADLAIGSSALYLLASDAVPDDVRAEFIDAAKAGQPVTHADVKAKLDAAKPSPSTPSPAPASSSSGRTRHVTADAQDVPPEDDAQPPPDDEPVVPLDPDSVEAAQVRKATADASDDLLKGAVARRAEPEAAALAEVVAAVAEPPSPAAPRLIDNGTEDEDDNPPVSSFNDYAEIPRSPEMRARKLIMQITGGVIQFHDDGILRELATSATSLRTEIAGKLRVVIVGINEVINELEKAHVAAKTNTNRPVGRKAG